MTGEQPGAWISASGLKLGVIEDWRVVGDPLEMWWGRLRRFRGVPPDSNVGVENFKCDLRATVRCYHLLVECTVTPLPGSIR